MIADAFRSAFKSAGYNTEITGDETLYFLPLSMTMKFERQYTQGVVTCIKVVVTNPELLPGGLTELAFGHGNSEAEQDENAAISWFAIDFPTIHAYLCKPGNDLNVKRTEMVSQTGDQQLGWMILLGPLSYHSDVPIDLPDGTDFEFIKVLLNTISGKLNTPKFLYLKCFVSKFSDGNINADCRLNGEPWLEATNDLYYYADTMQPAGQMLWYKQFIIIHPKELGTLKAADQLSKGVHEKKAELDRADKTAGTPNKKWFEFWKS